MTSTEQRHGTYGPRMATGPTSLEDLPDIPLLDQSREDRPRTPVSSVHPGIIARANIDTTIAVIPAEVCMKFCWTYLRSDL